MDNYKSRHDDRRELIDFLKARGGDIDKQIVAEIDALVIEVRGLRRSLLSFGKLLLVAGMSDGDPLTDRVAANTVEAIEEDVEAFKLGFATEVDLLNKRLVRRFDPAMALNEATQRAVEAKKAAKDDFLELTENQTRAMAVQRVSLLKALRSA